MQLFDVHTCGGGGGVGWDQAIVDVYKMALRSVEPDANIFKSGFHFFRSVFEQNTLQEISRKKRKYAQECLSGKKWVLKS